MSSQEHVSRPGRPSRNLSSLSLKSSSVPHFISSTTHDASVDYLDRPTVQRTLSGAHDGQGNTTDKSSRNAVTSTIGEEGASPANSQSKTQFRPYGGGATDAPIKVIDSSIAYTINHKNCQPTQEGFRQVVATLFYVNKGKQNSGVSADQSYGEYVSQAALFDFINTWDNLVVPWKKWDSSHRCLETSEEARVVELTVVMPEMLNLEDLRRHEDIAAFEQKWNIQVAIQPSDVFRKHKRLAVFDMDSTLIQQEVIDEIARYVGVEKEVSEITERAMNGELDFEQSLRLRVSLLKGVPSTVLESLKSVITFTPGARELCKALKALGFKMAVLSGGFIPLANYVKEELQLDYAYANQLVVSEDGKELTGELTGPIVHAQRKADLLGEIAAKEGINLRQSVAIGDGANDLVMMKKAGLGIAFNAKPKVQEEAPCRLNSESLRDVLFILGFTKGEVEDLLAL